MLSELVNTIVSKSIDKWSASKAANLLSQAMRDRLHREVRLNMEIWKLFERKKSNSDESFADLVSIKAFEDVCTLNLPLCELFGDQLLSDSVRTHLDLKKHPNPNKSYQKWAKGINTEIDLIERIWQRIHVLQARKKLEGPLGDSGYLMHLHRALDLSLKERKRCKLKE